MALQSLTVAFCEHSLTACKYFRDLHCISAASALCAVGLLPFLSPVFLPVRQLPIPPPRRPNILALHKFLMSALKSPATSAHWSFNLLRQTNTAEDTCFCAFRAALTSHVGGALRFQPEVLRGRQL